MSKEKVAIVTAGGSGMGAARRASWRPMAFASPSCPRRARARPWLENWADWA